MDMGRTASAGRDKEDLPAGCAGVLRTRLQANGVRSKEHKCVCLFMLPITRKGKPKSNMGLLGDRGHRIEGERGT